MSRSFSDLAPQYPLGANPLKPIYYSLTAKKNKISWVLILYPGLIFYNQLLHPLFERSQEILAEFLGDHRGWGVGIAGGDLRHDRGINDIESLDALKTQF